MLLFRPGEIDDHKTTHDSGQNRPDDKGNGFGRSAPEEMRNPQQRRDKQQKTAPSLKYRGPPLPLFAIHPRYGLIVTVAMAVRAITPGAYISSAMAAGATKLPTPTARTT